MHPIPSWVIPKKVPGALALGAQQKVALLQIRHCFFFFLFSKVLMIFLFLHENIIMLWELIRRVKPDTPSYLELWSSVRTGLLSVGIMNGWNMPSIWGMTLKPLSCWIEEATPISNFKPIRLLDQGCWYRFTYWMTNSADPDQLASSEANWSGSTLFAKAGYIRVQQDKG